VVLAATGAFPETFLPSPWAVVRALIELFSAHDFLYDIGASIYRVMTGFLLASILAVPLGVWIGSSMRMQLFIGPLVGFFRYLPVPSLVPLCILWIGIGNPEKIAVIFLGTFFQLTLMVADAARAVPRHYLDLSATLGLTSVQRMRHVLLPAALPAIYDALRVCVGWAWSYLVVAELVAASCGIGHVIIESQRYLATAEVFAAILTIGLLGVAFDQSFNLLKGIFFPWAIRKT
jgi:NitT/TauT family transport system permease protein